MNKLINKWINNETLVTNNSNRLKDLKKKKEERIERLCVSKNTINIPGWLGN